MHVLRADLDVLRFAERLHHLRNRGERWQDHYFDIDDVAQIEQQRLNKSRRLGLRHVHLPIGCDYFFAHQIKAEEGLELKIDKWRVTRRNK